MFFSFFISNGWRFKQTTHLILGILVDPVQEREANRNFTGCRMQIFIVLLIPYMNLLNLSWIKNVYFEEYGTFKLLIFSYFSTKTYVVGTH